MSSLRYMGSQTLTNLYTSILEDIGRYQSGDFHEVSLLPDWNLELTSIGIDPELLAALDPANNPEAEINNSMLVWTALSKMTPALACEDRIWTRLSHVECLDYSRKRWLNSEWDDAMTAKKVRTHFFADGLTACRDDHAIARLWWNAKFAVTLWPENQIGALSLFLKTADIRSGFVERSFIASRPPVACAILRMMERNNWVTEKEKNFREFMKTVNHYGGGMVFELMPEGDLDNLMNQWGVMAGQPE